MSDDVLKDKLSDFLSVSPDVFWETDTSGHVTYISMQITALVDHPPEKIIGKPLANLFHGLPCQTEWNNWVHSCLKGKLAPLAMIPVPNEDGRIVYVSAYAQRFAKGLRGYLRDVSEAVESTLNATEIERQLADTIEAIPYGVALFDKDDKLVFINNKNRDLFPGLQDLMHPGTPFSEFVRHSFEDGVQTVPPNQIETMYNKRMGLHRNGYGVREIKLNDDRWVEISERITPEGNTVISWSDLTVQKRREQALASLLSDEQQTLSVPERAAKAVALALGCRFGGVVRLMEGAKNAEVIALWDNDHFAASFGYNYAEAPCQKVYDQGGYIYMKDAATYKTIPGSLLEKMNIQCYHGLALRDQGGGLIGHIFAMDDRSERQEYKHGREVFHLIGHWVEMEFRRQDMHAAITESQRRFRDFAEVASDWFWEMDCDFNFQFVSEHAPLAAQTKLAELIRAAHNQKDTDWSQLALAQASSKVIAKRAFRDVPITVTDRETKQEMMFLVGARPVFDEIGEFNGYRGTGSDVTTVMQANQRATRAESWLWEAVESSPEAFALYDKDDRLLISNQKFKDIFFPKVSDQIKPGILFKDVLTLFYSQNISETPPEKIPQVKENRIRHRGLSEPSPFNETNVQGRIYLAVEHKTREGGVASFYIDITKLHEQEQILLRAKDVAESANRSKSEFLANISHELRTPLNAIIGFSELIRDDLAGPPNSPKYKEYINDIHNSGMHLMELINDILDLSKAEAGMIEGVERLTDVTEIIDACVKLMGPKAERAYVKLQSRYPQNTPQLWVDPKHLRQILLNLVSNSVKFTPEGGTVEVIAKLGTEGLSLIVRDTGIGMEPEDVPKAMAPFGQIDSSLARKYQGTGLGLPLTKRLMDYYQGGITIETAPNKGTTVMITFRPDRLRYADGSGAKRSEAAAE